MNITLGPQSFLNYENNFRKNPSFTSNYQVLNKRRPFCTYFFREDLQWGNFARYLNLRFKAADKVNIYNAACSDGTESYTLIMSLIKHLGSEKAEKFFPIKGFDLNQRQVNTAKSGEIPLLPGIYYLFDFFSIKLHTLFNDKKFLNHITLKNGKKGVKFKDDIKNLVEFRKANIFDELAKINKNEENSVFLCRNMWMYLKEPEQEKLAKMLSEACGSNSIVVLGNYDLSASKAHSLLLKNGFEETYIDNVYEKMVKF